MDVPLNSICTKSQV